MIRGAQQWVPGWVRNVDAVAVVDGGDGPPEQTGVLDLHIELYNSDPMRGSKVLMFVHMAYCFYCRNAPVSASPPLFLLQQLAIHMARRQGAQCYKLLPFGDAQRFFLDPDPSCTRRCISAFDTTHLPARNACVEDGSAKLDVEPGDVQQLPITAQSTEHRTTV